MSHTSHLPAIDATLTAMRANLASMTDVIVKAHGGFDALRETAERVRASRAHIRGFMTPVLPKPKAAFDA